jgi:DNA-binding NtrC family response regulator
MSTSAAMRLLRRSSEPHHLREAVKSAGEELSDPKFIEEFFTRTKSIIEKATSRVTVEMVEGIIDDLQEVIQRRIHKKLILAHLLVAGLPDDECDDYEEEIYIHPVDKALFTQKTTFFFQQDDLKGKKNLLHLAEKELILTVLEMNKFNRTQTSKDLGISVRTLRNKINEYLEEIDSSQDKNFH